MEKKFYKWKFILIPIGIIAFIAFIGFAVMMLWNNLLPDILHVETITFGQAIGIFVLCKILFGFGGKGGKMGGPWKGRMTERFKNMSPEEREAFKAQWEERCGWKGKGFGRRSFSSGRTEQAEEENINPS